MQLNGTQRKVILVGIAIVVLMGLFPPWKHTFRSTMTNSEEPAGYSFIATPPNRRQGGFMHGVEIDLSRLLIQLAVTIAAAGFGVLVTAKQRDKQST